MHPSTHAIACLVMVLACLSLYLYYAVKAPYTVTTFVSGMICGFYVFKTLWVRLSKNWISGAVIVLTSRVTIIFAMVQLLLQPPALHISAPVFVRLAIGVLWNRLSQTLESASGNDL